MLYHSYHMSLVKCCPDAGPQSLTLAQRRDNVVGSNNRDIVCTPWPLRHLVTNPNFYQCWFIVGPPSATLAQQWTSISRTSGVYWVDNAFRSPPRYHGYGRDSQLFCSSDTKLHVPDSCAHASRRTCRDCVQDQSLWSRTQAARKTENTT